MVTFRNNNTNNRRPPFRSHNNRRPPFRRNDEGSNFSNNDNFQRKVPGRNNHNASMLITKYNDLAREALANEDKILSENYFQHADHFARVLKEQENNRIARVNSPPVEAAKPIKTETEDKKPIKPEAEIKKETTSEAVVKREVKVNEKQAVEKKSAVS